jgi:hypothetical protein
MIKACSSKRCCTNTLAMTLYDALGLLLGNSMVLRRLGTDCVAYTYTQKYCKSETNGCWCLDWLESFALLKLDLTIASIGLSLLSELDHSAEARVLDAHHLMLHSSRVPDETKARFGDMMAFISAKHGCCREALIDLKGAQTLRQMA